MNYLSQTEQAIGALFYMNFIFPSSHPPSLSAFKLIIRQYYQTLKKSQILLLQDSINQLDLDWMLDGHLSSENLY